jgi:phosphomannomutase
MLMEYMAVTGKSISALIAEIYDEIGSFAVERYDLHVEESRKQQIIAACKAAEYKKFGAYTVQQVEDTDGYKFRLGEDGWVMIRPSGTEPVLRVYAEAADSDAAYRILDATRAHILS